MRRITWLFIACVFRNVITAFHVAKLVDERQRCSRPARMNIRQLSEKAATPAARTTDSTKRPWLASLLNLARGNSNGKQSDDALSPSDSVRQMAAFLSASLTQSILTNTDPDKDLSPKEQQAVADLLEAVMTPTAPKKDQDESATKTDDSSSSAAPVHQDVAASPTPAVASDNLEDDNLLEMMDSDEEQKADAVAESLTKPAVVESVKATDTTLSAPAPDGSEEAEAGTTVEKTQETAPQKPRLEAALKKALHIESEDGVDDQAATDETPKLDTEKPESLHRKEGDRVVALKDNFGTEDAETTGSNGETLEKVTIEESEKSSLTSEIETSTLNTKEMPVMDRKPSVGTIGPLQKLETVQNLVPPTPKVISNAFGRPLPVLVSDIPPLKSPPKVKSKTELTTKQSSNTTTSSSSSDSEEATTETTADSSATTAVVAKEKIVSEESSVSSTSSEQTASATAADSSARPAVVTQVKTASDRSSVSPSASKEEVAEVEKLVSSANAAAAKEKNVTDEDAYGE